MSGREPHKSALDEADRRYLRRAIEISRQAVSDGGKTPFGAVVVVDGQVVGEGSSRVVELRDPTAHAEVMAIRAACTTLGTHLLPAGVMYCSTEPCPLCLAACYWARIPRIVYAATSHDAGNYGFEDLWFYRELAKPNVARRIQECEADGDEREDAVKILRSWTEQLPFPIEPKI